MDIVLQTANLSKRFSSTLALDNVNMTIRRGDIYGFIGENGAGKSTLIRVISGINRASAGAFTLNVSEKTGSVAAIVETPALYGNLNAVDNLKTQSDLLKLVKTEAELHNVLREVGLESEVVSRKKARNFSLGMKQRLSIALALLSEPEFIMLDEPMNGLDPVGIKSIRDLIIKLNKEKATTFLISSHILNELDKVATVYGFISKGKLVEEISATALHEKATGLTQIVLEEPLSEKGAALLTEFDYELVDSKQLVVKDEKKAQKLFQTLLTHDIAVRDYNVIRETIEEYYFKVIGGGAK